MADTNHELPCTGLTTVIGAETGRTGLSFTIRCQINRGHGPRVLLPRRTFSSSLEVFNFHPFIQSSPLISRPVLFPCVSPSDSHLDPWTLDTLSRVLSME